jgi:glycosyltransferase involved in cell wall biosynthesis
MSVRVVGSIDDADLLHLTEAVASLVDKGLDVELCVLGRVSRSVDQIRERLGDRFVAPGYVPHRDAVAYVKGAALLVSHLSDRRSRSYQLTSKLFEFIASGRPTLEINPSRPDLNLLHQYNVPFLRFPTVQELSGQIETMLTAPADRSARVEEFRSRFSRQHQAEMLARVLTDVCERRPPTA